MARTQIHIITPLIQFLGASGHTRGDVAVPNGMADFVAAAWRRILIEDVAPGETHARPVERDAAAGAAAGGVVAQRLTNAGGANSSSTGRKAALARPAGFADFSPRVRRRVGGRRARSQAPRHIAVDGFADGSLGAKIVWIRGLGVAVLSFENGVFLNAAICVGQADMFGVAWAGQPVDVFKVQKYAATHDRNQEGRKVFQAHGRFASPWTQAASSVG